MNVNLTKLCYFLIFSRHQYSVVFMAATQGQNLLPAWTFSTSKNWKEISPTHSTKSKKNSTRSLHDRKRSHHTLELNQVLCQSAERRIILHASHIGYNRCALTARTPLKTALSDEHPVKLKNNVKRKNGRKLIELRSLDYGQEEVV